VEAVRHRMRVAGVKPKPVKAKGKDGRPRKRRYVPTWFVDQCAADAAEPTPKNDVTVRQAAEILGITVDGVESLIKKGFLTACSGEITCIAGYKREGRILSRQAVEARRDEKGAKYGPVAEQRRIEKAKSVLKKILADGKPQLRSEVVKQAKEKGVTHKHLKQAKKKLKVKTTRPNGGPGYWRWCGENGATTAAGSVIGNQQQRQPHNELAASGTVPGLTDAPDEWRPYPDLGVELNWKKRIVRKANEIKIEVNFSDSPVQWHILRAACEAYPAVASVPSIKDGYPGTYGKANRQVNTSKVNKKLKVVGIRIVERKLIKIGKPSD